MAFWDCDANTVAQLDAGLPDPRTMTADEASKVLSIVRSWEQLERSYGPGPSPALYQTQLLLHQLRAGIPIDELRQASNLPVIKP